MEKNGVIKLRYQSIQKCSELGSISYMWEHATYPETAHSTQRCLLFSLLKTLFFPHGEVPQNYKRL
jgi:hypothetical protein